MESKTYPFFSRVISGYFQKLLPLEGHWTGEYSGRRRACTLCKSYQQLGSDIAGVWHRTAGAFHGEGRAVSYSGHLQSD